MVGDEGFKPSVSYPSVDSRRCTLGIWFEVPVLDRDDIEQVERRKSILGAFTRTE
jgi:hypothetical protein